MKKYQIKFHNEFSKKDDSVDVSEFELKEFQKNIRNATASQAVPIPKRGMTATKSSVHFRVIGNVSFVNKHPKTELSFGEKTPYELADKTSNEFKETWRKITTGAIMHFGRSFSIIGGCGKDAVHGFFQGIYNLPEKNEIRKKILALGDGQAPIKEVLTYVFGEKQNFNI